MKQARDFQRSNQPIYTFLNAKSYNEAMTNSKGLDVIIVVVRTHNKEKQRDFHATGRSSQSRKYERTALQSAIRECSASISAICFLLTARRILMPAGFDNCVKQGGKVRTVTGPHKKMGITRRKLCSCLHS